MLNYSILSNHRQWASFLRGLRYVVLDEAHSYRGVFGAHIANLLRRLRRRLRALPHRARVLRRLSHQLQPGRVFLQAHRRATAGGHRHYRVHLRTR